MRRSVFTDGDAVVREDVDRREVAERREAERRAAVIGEHEERRAAGAEDAVRGDAVHDRAHAVLADAEADVAPRAMTRLEIVVAGLQIADVVQGRAVQIRAATDQQRVLSGKRLQHVLTSLAGRDLAVGRELGNRGQKCGKVRRAPLAVGGQRVRRGARGAELFRKLRILRGPLGELLRPGSIAGVELLFAGGEIRAHLARDVEVLWR